MVSLHSLDAVTGDTESTMKYWIKKAIRMAIGITWIILSFPVLVVLWAYDEDDEMLAALWEEIK
jgi:hypothetical protein